MGHIKRRAQFTRHCVLGAGCFAPSASTYDVRGRQGALRRQPTRGADLRQLGVGRAVTATRTRAAPHRPPLAVTCRRTRCAEQKPWALRIFGCSSVLREHLRTIRSACLVNSSENTHNTAPSSCSRARASRRLLCSPRDGLCSITFNKPTTSVTRHQLDTRDSVHSRQEPQARVNQRGPRACVGWGHTHALDCAGTDGLY